MGAGFTKDNKNENIGALFQAINDEKFKLAAEIISRSEPVNCINYFGSTPLIETCRNNQTSSRKSSSVENERANFVRFLIDNNCAVSSFDIYGWTALMYAEKNGFRNIASILENFS
ncbi:Hypothetical predicted protein [Mytilus galloprovincialis]|uniref:Uncharacterized protein n=1 Tax=Mytilus galloprovincialis TaxID=29158 RepID=A0A8B6C8J5_MYTGA|nr:Hypothetical predicted protein [Mytilus galloprovincialis]VDI46066.1 Hypothetical predicted protein [Mytilus galloprovincialis]